MDGVFVTSFFIVTEIVHDFNRLLVIIPDTRARLGGAFGANVTLRPFWPFWPFRSFRSFSPFRSACGTALSRWPRFIAVAISTAAATSATPTPATVFLRVTGLRLLATGNELVVLLGQRQFGVEIQVEIEVFPADGRRFPFRFSFAWPRSFRSFSLSFTAAAAPAATAATPAAFVTLLAILFVATRGRRSFLRVAGRLDTAVGIDIGIRSFLKSEVRIEIDVHCDVVHRLAAAGRGKRRLFRFVSRLEFVKQMPGRAVVAAASLLSLTPLFALDGAWRRLSLGTMRFLTLDRTQRLRWRRFLGCRLGRGWFFRRCQSQRTEHAAPTALFGRGRLGLRLGLGARTRGRRCSGRRRGGGRGGGRRRTHLRCRDANFVEQGVPVVRFFRFSHR
jgi:hypothetical protein